MNRIRPIFCRAEDDSAPNDYHIVGSVNEGQRLRQSEPMRRPTPADAVVRHRVDPDARETLRRAPQPTQGDVPGAIAPAQRVAYPRTRDNAFADAPSYDAPPPRTFAPAAAAQPAQPAPPPEREAPDWLRAAQHNHAPELEEERRRRAPRAAAPASEEYARAGYPPALIMEQQQADARARMDTLSHGNRHGAQFATGSRQRTVRPGGAPEPPPAIPAQGYIPPAAPPAQDVYAPPAHIPLSRYGNGEPRARRAPEPPPEQEPSYSDNPYVVRTDAPERRRRWHDEDEPPAEDEAPRPRKPWLGVAVIVAAALAVTCWLTDMAFTRATEAVLAARESAATALHDSHPLYYADLIQREAESNNLHPAFVAAIMLNESSFRPSAESGVGARGLMQLRSDTAEWIAGKLGDTGYTFDQMYEAEQNVRYGCWYLKFLCERFHGDPVLVAAAFHAGQNTVQNWLNDSRYSADGKSITLENMMDGPTKGYAARVLDAYAVYKRLYYEQTGA